EPAEPEYKTPPPSQPPSPVTKEQNSGKMDDDPWKISVSDLMPAPADLLTSSTAIAVAQGTILWLFDDSSSCFMDFHVCFNVRLHYNCGILVKWDGPAPPGCVCTTVTALHTTKIKHHTIPAKCLTSAAPKGKGDKCLILKGEKAGQIHVIKECRMKKQQVVLNNGTMLLFDDVCWVIGVHP
ncbi:hypothetical protein V8B97DRAFT_1876595, partial [Scleroderma yunnanense]